MKMNNRFAPGWPFTIAALAGLVILLALGTWQARKVGPKTALVEKIEAGLKAEPLPLPVHLDDPGTLDYRRVSFRGELMEAEPIRVFATSTGGKAGYHIYAPVEKQHGMAVLVNFGWVPAAMQEAPGLPFGATLDVTGVLRVSAEPGSMTPGKGSGTRQTSMRWLTPSACAPRNFTISVCSRMKACSPQNGRRVDRCGWTSATTISSMRSRGMASRSHSSASISPSVSKEGEKSAVSLASAGVSP